MKKPFDIYQRTFEFAVATIKLCRKISKEENEYIVTKQLYRSSSSVGAILGKQKMVKVKMISLTNLQSRKRNVEKAFTGLKS